MLLEEIAFNKTFIKHSDNMTTST